MVFFPLTSYCVSYGVCVLSSLKSVLCGFFFKKKCKNGVDTDTLTYPCGAWR